MIDKDIATNLPPRTSSREEEPLLFHLFIVLREIYEVYQALRAVDNWVKFSLHHIIEAQRNRSQWTVHTDYGYGTVTCSENEPNYLFDHTLCINGVVINVYIRLLMQTKGTVLLCFAPKPEKISDESFAHWKQSFFDQLKYLKLILEANNFY